MKTTSNYARYRGQQFRLILIVLVTILGIYCKVQAQQTNTRRYMGFEASFGNRAFTLNSNIQTLNKLRAGHEGGNIGIVVGNEVLKTRVKAGFFFSNSNNPRTQEIFESSASINFYPLELIRKNNALIHPYLTLGTGRTGIKYFGTYLDHEPYTGAFEPFLGKVSQYNVTGGIGLEMRLENDRDFIHFFAEGLFEKTYSSVTKDKAFDQTTATGVTSINFGISFGRKKF